MQLSTVVVGVTCAGAMLFQTPLAAQGSNDSGTLEEVIVSAERREASLQDVPVAVSAFSLEKLDNLGIDEAEDLQRYVPSLKMFGNITTPTNLSISLRGSLQQDASLVVAESPFGIYVDDIFVPRLNANNVTLADIERVEVLRGPQGTLYGRNTLAGAMKFISRDPSAEPWLTAIAGFGNHDQYKLSASVGGPINDDWAGSFAAQINEKDGQYFNATENISSGLERNVAWRGKIRYTGRENLDITLSITNSDSKNDATHLVPATTPTVPGNQQFSSDDLVLTLGEYTVGTPFGLSNQRLISNRPTADTEQTITSLKIAYEFDNATFTSITGLVRLEDTWTNDFSGFGLIQAGQDTDSEQWTQELNIQGTAFDDRLTYLAGAYFLKEDADQDWDWFFFTPITSSQIKADTTSAAIYSQLEYQFTDRLKGTAGIRWVEDRKKFRIDQQVLPEAAFNPLGFLAGPPGSADFVRLENDYEEITPKFGLDYIFETSGNVDSLMVYGSAASGFKGGGYNGIAIFNLGDAQTAYGPESNWTYEAGVKADMFGNTLRLNASYWLADVDDLTLNATANNNTSFPVQNAGTATLKGLEMEVTWLPIDGLTLFFVGAFSDGEFDTLDPTSAPAQAPVDFGVQPQTPQMPDYTYTIGFDYAADLSFGTLSFGMDYFETDSYITAATNDFNNAGWDRLNGFVALDINDNWSVRFSGKNLSDNHDISSGSRGLGGFVVLPPREYMLSVTYSH
jgi:iron complex outermembrane receptor protein